ncbi:MAG: SOS response-associated peptidase [Syntrophaceae bacterium]
MCGRFVFTDPSRIKALMPEAVIDEQVILEFQPNYNIAPSQPVLAMLNDGSHTLTYTRWGLIPSWTKDPSRGVHPINARAETLEDKPMFRALAQKRRCLIFADGFYEWRHEGKRKQPYFIHRIDRQPMPFAGLWDTWKNHGTSVISSTIITTAASAQLAPIHDRMPVILPPDCSASWLDPGTIKADAIKGCLLAKNTVALEAYAVSSLINNPQNSGPECILPLAPRS